MRNPAVRVLFLIFIGEHRFKGSAMQVEIKHSSGRESVWRNGSEELFLDRSVPQCAGGRHRARNLTSGYQQPHHRSRARKPSMTTVVRLSTGPRFTLPRLLYSRGPV